MSMTDEAVLLSVDRDGVRTLTLNRPHRKNAINRELWIALADALRSAGTDRSVRALVITGANGAFCSGADLSARDDARPSQLQDAQPHRRRAAAARPASADDREGRPASPSAPDGTSRWDATWSWPHPESHVLADLRQARIVRRSGWFLAATQARRPYSRRNGLALLAETIDAEEAQALNLVTWVGLGRGNRRVRRRSRRALRRRAAGRARADQGAAERGRRPHTTGCAGQRSPRAGSQFRNGRRPGGVRGVRREAGSRRSRVDGRCRAREEHTGPRKEQTDA